MAAESPRAKLVPVAERWKIREAAVYWVKKHRAADAEVEYDAHPWDPGTEQKRQVDVMIRGQVGDDPVVISVEVKDESEPLGSQTVEQLIALHRRLATNRLVIVSWSGFVSGALSLVERENGFVDALTPERADGALLPPLTWLETHSSVDGAELVLLEADGSQTLLREVPANANLYAAPEHDEHLCMLGEFLERYLNRHGREDLARQLSETDEPITHFSVTMEKLEDLPDLSLHVHDGDNDEFKQVSVIWAKGPLEFHRQSLEFDVWNLGDVTFAFTEGQVAGKDAVFVFTPTTDSTGLLSWQLL